MRRLSHLTWHTGQVVSVIDHAALDEEGRPKVRTDCKVRFVSKEKVLVYVPRYNAEIFFDKETRRSDNNRMEVVTWHIPR